MSLVILFFLGVGKDLDLVVAGLIAAIMFLSRDHTRWGEQGQKAVAPDNLPALAWLKQRFLWDQFS